VGAFKGADFAKAPAILPQYLQWEQRHPYAETPSLLLAGPPAIFGAHMKFKCFFALVAFAAATVFAEQQRYTLTPSNGFVIVSFTNKYPFGVSTLEGRLDRHWVTLENFFTTQLVGHVTLTLPPNYSEYRVRFVSIAPGNAFKNLALVYGNLETVAGLGPVVPPGTNAWLLEHEGAPATTVPLSNPRAVVADNYGHIYVLEKDSHALSVIDGTNGTFHTAIGPIDLFGKRRPGILPIEPGSEAPGRLVSMRDPSGLFYQNEKIYVLDAGNGRVLRYTNGLASPTNGTVIHLFSETNAFGQTVAITNGAGLWVSPDELDAYYTDGTVIKRWRADRGVETVGFNFTELTDIARNSRNDIIVVDHGRNAVLEFDNDGFAVPLAGTGFPTGPRIGKATSVALNGPTSIHFLPVGGYLVALDEGATVWQVDSGNNAARFVFGAPDVHDGDGEWFQQGRTRPKISNVRDVTLAPSGDILMVEGGYVRRINFLRHKP
jgi:hypothetical protein